MKRTKAKVCPECKGLGITEVLIGGLSESEKRIEVTDSGFTLCSRCDGIGIVGIKELKSLSPQQLYSLAKDRTPDEIFDMFNKKTQSELKIILASL